MPCEEPTGVTYWAIAIVSFCWMLQSAASMYRGDRAVLINARLVMVMGLYAAVWPLGLTEWARNYERPEDNGHGNQ